MFFKFGLLYFQTCKLIIVDILYDGTEWKERNQKETLKKFENTISINSSISNLFTHFSSTWGKKKVNEVIDD